MYRNGTDFKWLLCLIKLSVLIPQPFWDLIIFSIKSGTWNQSPYGNSEKKKKSTVNTLKGGTRCRHVSLSHAEHCQNQVYASSPCQTEGIIILLHNHKIKYGKPRWSLLPRHLPASGLNPGPHAWHLYEPRVFTHLPLGQTPGLLHSSTSVMQKEKEGGIYFQRMHSHNSIRLGELIICAWVMLSLENDSTRKQTYTS